MSCKISVQPGDTIHGEVDWESGKKADMTVVDVLSSQFTAEDDKGHIRFFRFNNIGLTWDRKEKT